MEQGNDTGCLREYESTYPDQQRGHITHETFSSVYLYSGVTSLPCSSTVLETVRTASARVISNQAVASARLIPGHILRIYESEKR